MTTVTDRPPTTTPRPDGSLGRAWLAIALLPVFFFLAFAAAEGLYALTGYDPGMETPPHWADLAALVPAGLVFLVPCVAAVGYGRRAVRAGQPWGYAPMVLGIAAVVGYTLLSAI